MTLEEFRKKMGRNLVKKRMGPGTMRMFIDHVGRAELLNEIKEIDAIKEMEKLPPEKRSEHAEEIVKKRVAVMACTMESRYLKGVLAALVELGFDEGWTYGTFKETLKKRWSKRGIAARKAYSERMRDKNAAKLIERLARIS